MTDQPLEPLNAPRPGSIGVVPPEQTIDGTVPAPAGLMKGPGGTGDDTTSAGLEIQARSQWAYARRRFLHHRLAMGGLLGLLLIFVAGIFANVLAPHAYAVPDIPNAFKAPTFAGMHPFGTDTLGRDLFSRTLFGIRTSLEVGFFVAIVSTLFGSVVGGIAGYYGGVVDNLLMRITDLVLTLPALAILLTVAALWGSGSQWRISFILAAFFWTGIARIMRGLFLSLREKEYVEAAKAAGAGDARIMGRHMLPNTLGPVLVNATLAVATAIITEAALSFLGLGLKPGTPSLGVLISEGKDAPDKWWLTVMPGLVLVFLVVCINFVGDGLRDALDPTQRRVRA